MKTANGTFKTYPQHHLRKGEDGFTGDEIRRGIHTIFTDYECKCGKVQSYPDYASNNHKCIRCGE